MQTYAEVDESDWMVQVRWTSLSELGPMQTPATRTYGCERWGRLIYQYTISKDNKLAIFYE